MYIHILYCFDQQPIKIKNGQLHIYCISVYSKTGLSHLKNRQNKNRNDNCWLDEGIKCGAFCNTFDLN